MERKRCMAIGRKERGGGQTERGMNLDEMEKRSRGLKILCYLFLKIHALQLKTE